MEGIKDKVMAQKKTAHERIFNFSAGPSALPLPVLEQAQRELLNFENCGMSVMEMSHRSKEFDKILARAEAGVRKNLNVPADYAVLFLQGGASLQFAMVPMNLYIKGKPVDVIHTGIWAQKAIDELAKTAEYRLAVSGETTNFMRLPRPEEIKLNPSASYVHTVSNNTIFGTQWRTFPQTGNVPLVSDMSSDIFSRCIDVSKFGLIFAGAQKNIGPSGVTLVMIRKDLAQRASKDLPIMLQYRTHIEHGSRYNTPPTFGIYIAALVMEWLEREGGVSAIEKKNEEKAKMLYEAIDLSGFYDAPVAKEDRSRMNVVFRIREKGTGNTSLPSTTTASLPVPFSDLENKFAKEAGETGLSGLKGHRSAGGLRASIYNATTLEAVKALIAFMRDFEKKNG